MSRRGRKAKSVPYAKMARYYDTVYHLIVDYEGQTDYLEKIFAKHTRRRPESVLDVACGTGNYTLIFAKRGYRTTGIDLSEPMIRIAKKKANALASRRAKKSPKFLTMDMRQIGLPEKYDVATVLFGGFGYLMNSEEVSRFLGSVKKQLNVGGLLVFEFWQDTGIRPEAARPSGNSTAVKVEEGDLVIVRSDLAKYDPQTNLFSMTFDFNVFDARKRTLDRFSETHVVKTYSISHIRELLERSGLKALAFYEGGVAKKEELAQASFLTFRILAVAKKR